ncbi:MAG: cell division protein DedD [Chloroflexia bacterium]|nr:cell division protein DedD [Chloroflexia bacterium]
MTCVWSDDDRQRKWDIRHLRLLVNEIAPWSKDPSTKVGALIISGTHTPVSWGYNGPPGGIADDPLWFTDREVKLKLTIHAEENAILNARHDTRGCTLYVTAPPCAHCTAKIIQPSVGLARVVYITPKPEFAARWAADLLLSRMLFDAAGTQITTYKRSQVV